jgi:hypothetical protein
MPMKFPFNITPCLTWGQCLNKIWPFTKTFKMHANLKTHEAWPSGSVSNEWSSYVWLQWCWNVSGCLDSG